MTDVPPSQLILTRDDIVSVAPLLGDINDLVEETYRLGALGQAEVPVKMGVHPNHEHSFLHAMPARVSDANALGVKWVSYFPGLSARGMPDSSGVIILNDPEHGHPVAIMEGMWVTSVRTAACGAVAARYLAKPDPKRLGLIGCGGLGHWSLRMLAQEFPSLKEVHVASKTATSREAFCAEMAQQGPWTLTPVDRIEDAVADMDIVVSSVPQGAERMIHGNWVSPGTLIIPLDVCSGWDDDTYARIDWLVTDDRDALASAIERRRPDLNLPAAVRTLGDLIQKKEGPEIDRATARIMSIPTGVASIDIMLAWDIYRRARDVGVGTEISLV